MKLVLLIALALLGCCTLALGTSISRASVLKVGYVSPGGSYKIYGLSITPSCSAGTYTFSALQQGDSASMSFGGSVVSAWYYIWQSTVGNSLATSEPFVFKQANSHCVITVSVGKAGSGTQNLYGLDEMFDGTTELTLIGSVPATSLISPTSVMQLGWTSPMGGKYQIYGISVSSGCNAGCYTFAATAQGSVVDMLYQGSVVASATYIWQTTIGGSLATAQEFEFQPTPQCSISIHVGKRGSGTMNLSGLNTLFDSVTALSLVGC